MDTVELSVRTDGRLVTDLSGEVAAFCRGKGDGLLHVFAPHATAGLALIELGSGPTRISPRFWRGSCRVTTVGGTATAQPGTAATTCYPRS